MIAHIAERISSGENFRCLEAAFVKACKEGAKSEKSQAPFVDLPQPSPDDVEALELAKRDGSIRGYYLAPYGDGSTVLVDDSQNKQVVPWWQFFKNEENQ